MYLRNTFLFLSWFCFPVVNFNQVLQFRATKEKIWFMIFHCLGLAMVTFGDSDNCLDFRSWTRKHRTRAPASCSHWFLIRSSLSNTINFVQNGITSHHKTNEENSPTTNHIFVVNPCVCYQLRFPTGITGHSCNSDTLSAPEIPQISGLEESPVIFTFKGFLVSTASFDRDVSTISVEATWLYSYKHLQNLKLKISTDLRLSTWLQKIQPHKCFSIVYHLQNEWSTHLL